MGVVRVTATPVVVVVVVVGVMMLMMLMMSIRMRGRMADRPMLGPWRGRRSGVGRTAGRQPKFGDKC